MATSEQLSLGSSLLVAFGGSAMSAYAPAQFPSHPTLIFWSGGALAFVGTLGTVWAVAKLRLSKMSENKQTPVIGTDINNTGGGIGLDIDSAGTAANPSIGGESFVAVPAGQSAIGTRLVQNGPGMGMRVVQRGPGVGFKSTVVVGTPNNK